MSDVLSNEERRNRIARRVEIARRWKRGENGLQIAAALGVSTAMAYDNRDYEAPADRECERCGEPFPASDPRTRFCSANCRKRQADDRYRAVCVDCGAVLCEGSAWRGSKRCRECHDDHTHALVHERALRIEEWWREGLPLKEIAARLGWGVGHLHRELHRLREAGYDLPYRYTTGKRAGRRFPEQVPS